MEKLSSMLLAVAFMLSVVGVVFAANPVWVPVEKAPPMAEEQAAPAGEKKASKAKSLEVTGTIDELDAAAGTFTVKGKKGYVDLKAGDKVKLTNFKVGDKVTVKYSDGTASSVKATKSKKSTKKSTKKSAEKSPKKSPKKAAAAPAPKAVRNPTIFPDAEKKPAEK
ncbi:MAG: hypothetical protein IH610_00665 [Deltaproteobacteria bacterium]|nr:hypothetical protein [Deltaproteobacteria bacterium]